MEQQSEDPQQPLWLAESVRFTAFPLTPPPVADQSWWSELTGRSPKRTVHELEDGKREDEGPFQGGRLVVSVQPGRIDLRLLPGTVGRPSLKLERLAPFGDVTGTFAGVVRDWLTRPDIPELQRLAFGAVLLEPVESREAGYRRLMDLVPGLRLDTEAASDVLFQVNRPRRSRISDLKINRLAKWSVASLQTLSLTLSGPAVQRSVQMEKNAVRLEVDINSDAAFPGPLQPGRLPEVFNELVALAREIANDGDRP